MRPLSQKIADKPGGSLALKFFHRLCLPVFLWMGLKEGWRDWRYECKQLREELEVFYQGENNE